MTSRVGSLLIAALLGGIAIATVIVVVVLIGDDGSADSSQVSLSLRDGDFVGLGLSTEISVIARDENAVTQVELYIDAELITRAVPFFDEESGDYRAPLIWEPQRLGEASVLVRAVTSTGEEIDEEITVEVVDPEDLPEEAESSTPGGSAAAPGAGSAVLILSPQPGDQVPLDTGLAVLVRGPSEVAIRSFVLEVNGTIAGEEAATLTESGDYQAVLVWQPTQEGPATLAVRGTTAEGDPVTAGEVTVEVVSAGGSDDAEAAEAEEEGGQLTILAPDNNDDFDFTENIRILISVLAEEVGFLTSVELFVNTVSASSVVPEALSAGLYRIEVPFEPSEPGLYALEVVAFADDGGRFSDQVVITVGGETAAPDGDRLPDLAATSVGVGEGNAIEITLSNLGDAPLLSVPVVVGVARSSDGILLDETTLDVTLAAGASRLFTLPIRLAETLQITLIVDTRDTVQESNEDNNQITALFQPAVRADLVAQALEVSEGGQPIVRIGNVGASDHVGAITVLLLLNGESIEQLGFNGLLASQGSLTLTGNIVVTGSGQLSAIVDPEDLIVEASESNNTITIELGG